MAYRRLKVLLLIATCMLLSIGLLLGWLLLTLPLSIEAELVAPIATNRRASDEKAIRIPQLEDFGESLVKRFQEPLEDPVPPAVAPEPKKTVAAVAARLDIVLLGTAVESTEASSKAWLRPAGKPVRLVSVGDRLRDLPGEPELVSIEVGSVILRVGEQEQTIVMAKQELK